mmetsp:Transcript_19827/g.49159  ORF Transcript_19827/g.49159 Transcript_19827/m.49159 type:complete len:366 (+) Transcript_19827:405-1502(+)
MAGDNPTRPRLAPKCFAPNSSMTSVGMAQKRLPYIHPTQLTPTTRPKSGAVSLTPTDRNACPAAIPATQYTVNMARLTRAARRSDSAPDASRPKVFMHARSLSKLCVTIPAVGASWAYAPTIWDRLLMTVTPAPRLSSSAVKSSQKSSRDDSATGPTPSCAALTAICALPSIVSISDRTNTSCPVPPSNTAHCAASSTTSTTKHAAAMATLPPATCSSAPLAATCTAVNAHTANPRVNLVSVSAPQKMPLTARFTGAIFTSPLVPMRPRGYAPECPACPDTPGPLMFCGECASEEAGTARWRGWPTSIAAHTSIPPAKNARKYTKDAGEVKNTSYTSERHPLLRPKNAVSKPTRRPCIAGSLKVP